MSPLVVLGVSEFVFALIHLLIVLLPLRMRRHQPGTFRFVFSMMGLMEVAMARKPDQNLLMQHYLPLNF